MFVRVDLAIFFLTRKNAEYLDNLNLYCKSFCNQVEDRCSGENASKHVGVLVSRIPISIWSKKMKIEVRFGPGITASQATAFGRAADRWMEVITGDFVPVTVDNEVIDGLLIEAQGLNIDGQGSVLGQAGPTLLRPNSMIPIKGIMEFDTADLSSLEQQGTLFSVVLHEMGHVLGLGTLWQMKNLLSGSLYTGLEAAREYGLLIGTGSLPVPVENMGGPGTAGGHWRESTFGDELMTGFLSGQRQPLSRVTAAALTDLEYIVDVSKADKYSLELDGAIQAPQQIVGYSCSQMRRPVPTVLKTQG
jgi:Matrixin/Leishmanolysin